MIQVKINMLDNCGEFFPRKAHEDDAAYDLRARVDIILEPGKSTLVPAGFKWNCPSVMRHRSAREAVWL